MSNKAVPRPPKFPGTTQNLLNHLSTYLVLNLVPQPPNGHFYFTKFYLITVKPAVVYSKFCEFTVMTVKLSKVKVPIWWL